MFAANTMPQSRPSRPRLARLNCLITGNTTVIVFSVKSCWRERTTIRKPTEYPKLVTSGRQIASGRCTYKDGLGQKREADRKTRRDPRPPERDDRPRHLLFAESTDDLINDGLTRLRELRPLLLTVSKMICGSDPEAPAQDSAQHREAVWKGPLRSDCRSPRRSGDEHPQVSRRCGEVACQTVMLTAEQKGAVRCDEDLVLTACPGSGKTRVIISKLSRVINEIRDTPRAAACITYINAAAQEIEFRLRHHFQPGDDGCTIHSFCLNHIFRPFCHLINGYKHGFKVLTPEDVEFERHVTAICAQHGRHNLTFKDFEDFTQLRVSLDGTPVGGGIERGALMPEVATAYWKRICMAGFIDFANIIYYSLLLLRKRPEILSYVSAKFACASCSSATLASQFSDLPARGPILQRNSQRGSARVPICGSPAISGRARRSSLMRTCYIHASLQWKQSPFEEIQRDARLVTRDVRIPGHYGLFPPRA
jgi:UvrD-like helicase family protein